MKKERYVQRRVLLLSLILSLALPEAAMSQTASAGVSGVVKDDKGQAVAGTLLSARQPGSNITINVVTDASGRYRMPGLQKGAYDITARKKGYKEASRSVAVDGPAAKADFAIALLGSIPVTQLTSADIIAHLPEGDGKMMVAGSCGACHSLSTVFAAAGRSAADWAQTVKRMRDIPGGYIQVNDRNSGPITEYLSRFLGPGSTLPQQIGDKVKATGRQELALGHDILYREYDVPTPISEPHTAVPDGRGSVWFSEFGARQIGRLDIATGKIREYPLKTPDSNPHGLTVGPDGVVWYPAFTSVLGRIKPGADSVEEFQVPARDGKPPSPHSIIVAKDGKVWFTEQGNPGSINTFDPATEKFHRYAMEPDSSPYGIIEHNGKIWFTLVRPGKIGVLDPKTGDIQSFPVPTKDSAVRRLRFDSRERVWFGEYATDKIGMLDPATKEMAEFTLPFRGSPYSLHVDRTGNVWVACFDRDSLIRFDPETRKMREYPLPGIGVIIRDIWQDADGRMWFMQWGRNKVTSAEVLPDAPERP